jgi:hypothetical protein
MGADRRRRGNSNRLSLDFLSSGRLEDPRIDFSRGTNAMVVDATGNLTYAPNNLLSYSNTLTDASWIKTNVTVAGGVPDRDGGNTAFTITCNVTGNSSFVYQPVNSSLIGVRLLNAVWIRRRTGSGTVAFRTIDNVDVDITAAISSGAWVRISNYLTSAALSSYFVIRLAVSGDAVDVWQPQQEAVTYQTTPSAYNPTTATAYYGPRFDYNPTDRTNLIYPSEPTFAQLVAGGNCSNATTTQDTAFARSIQFGDNSVLRYAYLSSSPAAGSVTFSFYVKMDDGSLPIIGTNTTSGDMGIIIDQNVGTINLTITNAGSLGYRVSATLVETGLTGRNYGVVKYTGQSSKSFRVSGYQLETSPYATPYIPTTTAAVTAYGQRTNLLSNSVWVGGTAGTEGSDAVTPTGYSFGIGTGNIAFGPSSRGGNSIRFTAVAQRPFITNSVLIPVTAGFSYTNSVYIDSITSGSPTINDVIGYAGNPAGTSLAFFVNGLPANSTDLLVVGTRVSYVATVTTTGTIQPRVGLGCGGNVTADVTVSGQQFEKGNVATAYIPTTTAPVSVCNTPLGLLVEESSTNLLTYSNTFTNAVWLTAGTLTVSANASVVPDGTTNAYILTTTTSNSNNGLYQTTATGAAVSTNYTASTYFKAGSSSVMRFGLTNQNESSYCYYDFNLIAGTASIYGTLNFTANSYTIKPVGNGWYRCTVSATSPATSVTSIGVFTRLLNSIGTVYAYGAQLEALPFATSYIPTISATVTRNGESVAISGSNFSQWFNTSEGTFIFKGSCNVNIDSFNPRHFLRLGPGSGYIAYTNANNAAINTYDGATALSPGMPDFTIPFTHAFSFTNAGVKTSSLNKSNPSSNATNSIWGSATLINIGNVSGITQMDGHVTSVTFLPTAYIGTALQELAT